MRPIGVEDEHDDVPVLPDWVEGYFAEQRKYWRTLRAGEAITVEQQAKMIQAESQRLSSREDEGQP